MRIKYDKKELANDIRSLEGRGIDTDVAKELAEFKRLIDCAAHTWDGICWDADEDNVPEDVSNAFYYAHAQLEQAYYEVMEVFPEH